ncbi:MAG: HD domain-containing protein, partial [Desulfobacteraceae bacterium]|nr:HD domain-containing protein [Desulfobacteraceae bacterium]
MDLERLSKQVAFLIETDKLKRVLRQTLLTDGKHRENSGEHSWHLALLAIVMQEYAREPVDLPKVLKMILVHDLVEIDAGDTYCYDEEGNRDKAERENVAADRIFSILPADQAEELRSLWEEFEARESADARFAAALDRFQPLLLNYTMEGVMWRKHDIRKDQVYSRNSPMAEGAPQLWKYAEARIRDAISKGWIR